MRSIQPTRRAAARTIAVPACVTLACLGCLAGCSATARNSSGQSASSSASTPVSSPSGEIASRGPQLATISKSRTFDLRSRNGRVYRIFVADPVRPMPPEGFPVVYVLDANAMFATVAEATRFQKNLTPAVVVGIGYPTDAMLDPDRRYFEYTPVTPEEKLHQSPNEPSVKPGGTGGQDEFLAFIEDELKPAIAASVNVDPGRQAIFGHSLAGRFVLHALFARPGSFQTYIASSPSIWWGESSVLDEERSFTSSPAAELGPGGRPVTLLLTAGEFEQRLTPATPPERAAFLTRARMVDNAREMSERLSELSSRGLAVEFREFAGENHGSVLLSAINRGINTALKPPGPR